MLIVDLQRVGGVTEWMRVAAMAQAWHVPVASHLFDEFSLPFDRCCGERFHGRYMPWWDIIYQEPPRVKNGHIEIMEKPGLGWELDAGALKRFKMG